MVSHFCEQEGERRRWFFSWRRELFQWELDLVSQLNDILEPVVLSLDDDSWIWRPDVDGIFSVNSAYNLLVDELRSEDELEEEVAVVFEQLWESPAPSKCVGCVGSVESSIHLFLHCPCALRVWYGIFRWLGVVIVAPPSLMLLFKVMKGAARGKKTRSGFFMIWHATIWCIWKAQNKSIFDNDSFIPDDIVENIKVVSWKWSLARMKTSPCMFYEWNWDPGECLLR
ncbi:hypothetical protein TSUD_33690 [Trifolium subterraneum]|uniref:Reverse transcriptase zinc-binding domain-containing protein n=1 Tax=Trifolium subterraneum TaxID=3900 RepID=A0A2Z6M8W4_TRISU|nr:hypothetical protein TSUD_33690 [Trifolium subterraneum]